MRKIKHNFLKLERLLSQAQLNGGIPDDSSAINQLLGFDSGQMDKKSTMEKLIGESQRQSQAILETYKGVPTNAEQIKLGDV